MINFGAHYSWRTFLLHLSKALAVDIDWNIKRFYGAKYSGHKNSAHLSLPTEGIIMIDAKGKIIQLTPAAAALFRYNISELHGQSIQVLIPSGNFLLLDNDEKGIFPGPWFGRKKEGSEFPAQLCISYCQQPGERLAFISVIDISLDNPICTEV
jgi:PAS domain S-box-containing protein